MASQAATSSAGTLSCLASNVPPACLAHEKTRKISLLRQGGTAYLEADNRVDCVVALIDGQRGDGAQVADSRHDTTGRIILGHSKLPTIHAHDETRVLGLAMGLTYLSGKTKPCSCGRAVVGLDVVSALASRSESLG